MLQAHWKFLPVLARWLGSFSTHSHLRCNFILAHSIYTQNELNRIIFVFVFGAIKEIEWHSFAATSDSADVTLFFQPPRPTCACVLHFNYMSDKISKKCHVISSSSCEWIKYFTGWAMIINRSNEKWLQHENWPENQIAAKIYKNKPYTGHTSLRSKRHKCRVNRE